MGVYRGVLSPSSHCSLLIEIAFPVMPVGKIIYNSSSMVSIMLKSFAECHMLSVIIPSVIVLTAIVLTAIVLSVICWVLLYRVSLSWLPLCWLPLCWVSYAECHMLSVIVLRVIMLTVSVLSVIMLTVSVLSVVYVYRHPVLTPIAAWSCMPDQNFISL